MIKNLLYSLFLHFLLLLAIYTNFNIRKSDEKNTAEVSVALISIVGTQNANKLEEKPVVKNEEKKPEKIKKEETQNTQENKAKSQKESEKNKVKNKTKKAIKSTPVESKAKDTSDLNKKEFKEEETSKKINNKEKQDEENKNENLNKDENNNKSSQEEDLGASDKKEEEEKSAENESKAETSKESENVTNNLENLNLSAREKFNIQSQLRRCYNRAIDETQLESDIKITVKTTISEDGYIESDLNETLDKKRYNDPKESNYKIAIDNARRAIDLCSPLRNLPLDKYYIWKEVVLDFGKEN